MNGNVRERKMASNIELSRWKSEPNLANRCFQRMRRSSSLGDIQYKNVLEEQMRTHLQSLKDELARERLHVTELKRENVSNVRLAREQEIIEARATQKDLLFKMMVQKDEEMEELKDNAKESANRQLSELEILKSEEARRLRKEFEYEKEQLINVLAGSFREEARIEIGTQFEQAKRQMDTEYFMLVSENQKLKSDLQMVKDADANKAEEIHKIYKEYNKALSKVKHDASLDSRRQLGEIRQLKRVNSELERKLELESGSCLKLQMEKESLEDALAKLRLADSWEKRTHRSSVKGIGGIEIEAAHAISLAPKISSRPHNAPERVLQRKVLEMTSLVRRLDESNQNFAARNQELVNELENIKNERQPFKQKAKRLGDKNMELVQSNKRKDERIIDQQQEILSLKDKLKTYDEIIVRKNKEISKLKSKVQVQNETETNREENDALQGAMQEQLKIIYELRQQTVEKDRRIGVLRERMQKMKSKRQQKENGRKSTSPDSLNGSSKEDDDVSTTSESLNDLFLDEFEVAFESNSINQGSDKYKQLLMENLELEKAYSKLQSEVGGQNDSGRMQLEIDALHSDLLVSQAQIQQLENQLEDVKKERIEIQNSNNNNHLHEPQYDYIRDERDRLRSANKVLHNKLISTESELLSKSIEITRISQDLLDVEEQRDLLEFRIAELEESTKEKLSEVQSLSVADDEKMGLDQEEDDVECDTLSVRIALKELEINRQRILKKRERSAIEKALDLFEIREKEIRVCETKEKETKKLLNDLECKYNNIKNELIQKEQQISFLTKEKCKSEERDLLSIEDIFKEDKKALELDNENLKQINSNQAKLLVKAQKDIAGMETANIVLKQQLEKYEKEKKTELFKYKHEIQLLEEKVSELEKVKKRLVKVEGLNMELQYKLENIKIEKYARDLVGNVVYSLPNSIAEEIKNLDEEKRTLLVELEELKNCSKEPILADIQDYTAPPQQDQFTQTEADQDEIPWHKYMSPRSERSLSRNDSGLTSRLQTDEGTQTPRIHEYDDLLERLEHEDHLKSAATQKEDVNNGTFVTFNV